MVQLRLEDYFPARLASGTWGLYELDRVLDEARGRDGDRCEDALERKGWYGDGAEPYPYPATPVRDPEPADPPVVKAVRNLWIAKFNPASANWNDPETGESGSDVDDESLFPWSSPTDAVFDGNYWLSTLATPANRIGIEAVNVGDLVLVQRSDPIDRPELRKDYGATDVIVGVAIAIAVEEWNDVSTGTRERRISLQPAARFRWPIPRSVARSKRRMVGGSFQRMPQLPDGTGPLGFTLSAVPADDCPEALAVCGISPEALAESDLGVLAARLKATARGNKEFWDYRWNHVVRHAIRTKHEQAAVERCKRWAARNGLIYRCSAEYVKNAGYDLLFIDGNRKEFQCEVKGYSSSSLAMVHLQTSQAKRAEEDARGVPPDWRLFAVLKVNTDNPSEHVLDGRQVTALIAEGGLQIRLPR